MEFVDFAIEHTEMDEHAVIRLADDLIVDTFETEEEAKAFALGYEKALGVISNTN